MSSIAYKQEILAEDLEDVQGALWKAAIIDKARLIERPQLDRVGIGVDPSGGAAECGIIVAGIGTCLCKGTKERHGFVLQDCSLKDSPDRWAKVIAGAYKTHRADRVFAESNFGGDMVEQTIRTVDPSIAFKAVTASRGKAIRAEPISALYEQGKVHHLGRFDALESEMVSWQPGVSSWSPNRLDALVWVLSELMTGAGSVPPVCLSSEDFAQPEDDHDNGFLNHPEWNKYRFCSGSRPFSWLDPDDPWNVASDQMFKR
jgi:phage terminase large subunit-like protein